MFGMTFLGYAPETFYQIPVIWIARGVGIFFGTFFLLFSVACSCCCIGINTEKEGNKNQ